nr:1-acyl-sn-glycerol-3-phosphate acyltransferase [Oceanococcus sp. HetDA_MAG_MS8]
MRKKASYPALPPQAPRANFKLLRKLGQLLMRLHGWRIVGEFPAEPKMILVGLPHTSNWDGYYAILFLLSLNLRISMMIKHTALQGPLGGVMRRLGFVGINRKAAKDVAGQMVEQFRQHERFWLAITPEGTRTQAAEIKTGFHRIARAANVPLLPVAIDFKNKCVRILPPLTASADVKADLQALLALYPGVAWPRHPERMSAPMRQVMQPEGTLIEPPRERF